MPLMLPSTNALNPPAAPNGPNAVSVAEKFFVFFLGCNLERVFKCQTVRGMEPDEHESIAVNACIVLNRHSTTHQHSIHTRTAQPATISVNELMLAYIEHAENHYRSPEGKPTGGLARPCQASFTG